MSGRCGVNDTAIDRNLQVATERKTLNVGVIGLRTDGKYKEMLLRTSISLARGLD